MNEKQKNEDVQEIEIQEKKEKFLKTQETPGNNTGPPIYLMALLVILGILAGYGANIMLQPTVPINNDTPDANTLNDLAYRTVPIIMLYSDDCKGCRQTNTIEELFIIREIEYELTQVEANSEEGKELLEKFDKIETLPTAIIDEAKMAFYPNTKKYFDGFPKEFKKENGYYLAPEFNLNENFYYPNYFVEKIGGLCNNEEKPTVIHFNDYYAEGTAKNRIALYDFFNDFNQSVNIKYVFAQAVSTDNNAILTNLFLTCAGEQGKYAELEKQITGIYCNNPFSGDETKLTQPEIAGCWTLSDHYGTSLTQVELDIAIARAGLDNNEFVTCVENQDLLLTNAEQIVKEVGLTKIPPAGVFLIGCKETSSLDTVKKTLCTRQPNLEACAVEENAN